MIRSPGWVVGEGSCNSWEAKYRYRWVAEEQVPEHLDRTHLAKRGVHRTLCEFEFAIERAETTGTYGKPAGHWQRFRDAIHAGAARSVETDDLNKYRDVRIAQYRKQGKPEGSWIIVTNREFAYSSLKVCHSCPIQVLAV